MKKLLFAALITVSLMSSAFASPVEGVSYFISNSFAGSFPKATNVNWKVTANFTKASFILNNVPTEAFYDRNGEFIGTSRAIAIDQMPTHIKRIFAKKYSGYTVKESIEFSGIEETSYYISAENEKGTVILKAARGVIEVVRQ
ncbi:MAG TPA: hypothetical protein VF610_08820 [Segetibacter sp.]|jgi:hypothetical protein